MASFKRVEGKTPHGGDYSEIYYRDDKGNVVDESEATMFALRECKKDGTLVSETFGFMTEDIDDSEEE